MLISLFVYLLQLRDFAHALIIDIIWQVINYTCVWYSYAIEYSVYAIHVRL